ncbi:MAG: hypothetical protein Q4G64_03320 [bacterium]|nr:hypothetical protein [bacterium]
MTETPQPPERAQSGAPGHGVVSDSDVGLDLPRWPVWLGTALWVAGAVFAVIAIIRTVQLVRQWDSLADTSGDLTLVVIRWALAIGLLTAGLLLASANGRARSRAARETLNRVR